MNKETPSTVPLGINPIYWVGMSQSEKREYSIANLMRGILSGNPEGPEFDVAEVINKKKKKKNSDNWQDGKKSFPIPYDILCDPEQHINSQITSTRGTASFIDTVRARSTIMSLDPMVVLGCDGYVEIIPEVVVRWGSIADVNTADEVSEPRELHPKIFNRKLNYTQSMLQTSLIDPYIYDDLSSSLALLIDLVAIARTKTKGEPTGILNTDGINTITWAEKDGITRETISKFPKALAEKDKLQGNPAFILPPIFHHSAMAIRNRGIGYLMNNNQMLEGYRMFLNTHAGNNILFGDFRQLMLALWGTLELSRGLAGVPVINVSAKLGVGVCNAASFCKGIPT